MIGFLVVGLVVGFVLGWGVYWYLQQQDSSAWTVPQFIREQPLARKIQKRVGSERPVVGGELFERTRTMLEHDAEAAEAKQVDDEPADTGPVQTTSVTSEEPESSQAESDSDVETFIAEDDVPDNDEHSVKAYCLSCQVRRQIQNAQRTETRTGRIAVRGVCPECGSELFTFVSTKNYD